MVIGSGGQQPTRTREPRCIGFGDREGVCTEAVEAPSPLWCGRCEADRRATISEQFRQIDRAFTESREAGQ